MRQNGGGSVQAIGAIGMTLAGVDLFPQPPRGTPRRPRRQRRRQRTVRRPAILSAVGRLLAEATQDPTRHVPRVRSYPY